MLDVKIVNYQQNFAPRWCLDIINLLKIIVVIFRIVRRNKCADGVVKDLLIS